MTCSIPDNSTNKEDYGFVVLNHDGVISEAEVTLSSLRSINKNCPITLVTHNKEDVHFIERKDFDICISSDNLVDMFNVGIQNSKKDWNFVSISGRRVTSNLIKKFLYFCRENNDLLYFSTRKKWSFPDAPLEFWFFNKNSLKPMIDQEGHFPLSKIIWTMEQDLKVKAIIGGLLR